MRRWLERFLTSVVIALVASLTLVVIAGVTFRKGGAALVWYDEVASILLAWLTFYGAALAALHRSHIGFPRLVQGLRDAVRVPVMLLAELMVTVFFAVVAWAGFQVLVVLQGDVLVSLPWVPRALTQSAVPVAAVLFVLAQLVSLPGHLASAAGGEGGDTGDDDEASGGEGSEPGVNRDRRRRSAAGGEGDGNGAGEAEAPT